MAAVGGLLLFAAGCAAEAPAPWRLVTPTGVAPTSMFVGPAGWYVGGAGEGPVLVVRDGDAWRGVPTTPASGYGRVATLLYLAADPAGRVVALGTATGGAHLNPRWTAWLGNTSGIVEEPQTVETFGGPEAGGITGVVYGDEPGVVGAWSLGPGGIGVAVWRHAWATWLREPSRPALAGSPPAVMESATAVTAVGGSTVLVGIQTSLVAGGVQQRAVLWRSDGPGGDWRRIDLDAAAADSADAERADTDSAATDVACADDGCLVVGRSGDTLAGWQVTGDRVESVALPRREVDRYLAEPRVARDGQLTAIAVGDGSGLLTRRGAGPWTASTTPAGQVRTIGVDHGKVVLLLRGPDGDQQVYRSAG